MGKRKVDVFDCGPLEHYEQDSCGLKKSKLSVNFADSEFFTSSLTDTKEVDNTTVSFISAAAKRHADREP